jgi:putative acetyltransferase
MSANIIVRPVHPDDAAQLYAIVTHPQVTPTLLQLPSNELSQTKEWVRKVDIHLHRLVAVVDGRIAGSVNLHQSVNPRSRHTASLGIMVHPDHWGQGVGSALMAGILDIADNWLNLLRVQLEVMTHNTRAIGLYKKFGFVAEGIRRDAVFGAGQYHDELLMARLRHTENLQVSTELPPPPTRTRPAVRQLSVRTFRESDLPDVYHLIRDPLVARTTGQLPSLELPRLEQRMLPPMPERHRLVADADGQVVGTAHLVIHKKRRTAHVAGLGMHVHRDYWGLGVGTQLMTGLMDLADNWLNLHRVELEVNTDNPAGLHLYQKFGFEIEGTIRYHFYGAGRWADSYFMSRIRNRRAADEHSETRRQHSPRAE